MNIQKNLELIQEGFKSLSVDKKYKEAALENIELWLSGDEYADYVPQIEYLIEVENWDLLLDCFYQVIPFGTAGRRGPVGIGPNRINNWTMQASAQGHSQYLLSKYGDEAKERGIVISYDVRKYLRTDEYDDQRLNPVKELDCKTITKNLAEVYTANGLKVYMFKSVNSTPELSFMVRHFNAVAGSMTSASHNPPEFNGQKVMDENGGQLVPPFDEELVQKVVDEVEDIKTIEFEEAEKNGLIHYIEESDHQAYVEATMSLSLADYRGAKVLFSPYHGTTVDSVMPVLEGLGHDVVMDPTSSKPDPKFSSIMFNIPNPEVTESYLGLIPYADEVGADIILTADPDGDRCGLMTNENGEWRFMTGNEILIITAAYILDERERQGMLKDSNVLVKTQVSTDMLSVMAEAHNVKIIPDLLVGFKYVAREMNILAEENRSDDLIMAGEESNGLTAGSHMREKDAAIAGVYLAELSSKLKQEDKTIGNYLDDIYERYGFFRNYLTEIRLPGAEGMSKIASILKHLREERPKQFGKYKVIDIVDRQEGEPFLSNTDKVSRDQVIFYLEPDDKTRQIRLIIRPSGTEPKAKFYFEVGRKPIDGISLEEEKKIVEEYKDELEKEVLKYCYKVIGIDFPDHGFLLFWMLPALDKMKYFEVEPEIEKLTAVADKANRKEKLFKLLEFLGADPIEKVDKAFKAKNQKGILEFLDLE